MGEQPAPEGSAGSGGRAGCAAWGSSSWRSRCWRPYEQSAPVALPAGTHDITLSVPSGGGGWYLSLMILQRAP